MSTSKNSNGIAGHKRQSSSATHRGDPQSPYAVAGSASDGSRRAQRVLALKVAIDWKRDESRKLYQRLRDLSWQAAHYRNSMMRRRWAEAMGFRLAESDDKSGISKQGRKSDKGELSGAAYSAAEREVQGAWQRDGKKMLAGQPLAEWKTSAALSIRGHKNKKDSGVRLELIGSQYVVKLSAQAATCDRGCWLTLPIAPHARRDEHQGDILRAMVAWDTPIAKATVQIKKHGVIVRLTYAIDLPALPAMGKRVAVLGPIESDGGLHLRTETESRDYTTRLRLIGERKEHWDGIRRRVMAQIGWRKGHARRKRQVLSRMTWDDWLNTHLHSWSRDAADWCASQGVGTIQIQSIETGDWPAWKLKQLLEYKSEVYGITVIDGASIDSPAAARAAKTALAKVGKQVRKRAEATRELAHQIKERIA